MIFLVQCPQGVAILIHGQAKSQNYRSPIGKDTSFRPGLRKISFLGISASSLLHQLGANVIGTIKPEARMIIRG